MRRTSGRMLARPRRCGGSRSQSSQKPLSLGHLSLSSPHSLRVSSHPRPCGAAWRVRRRGGAAARRRGGAAARQCGAAVREAGRRQLNASHVHSRGEAHARAHREEARSVEARARYACSVRAVCVRRAWSFRSLCCALCMQCSVRAHTGKKSDRWIASGSLAYFSCPLSLKADTQSRLSSCVTWRIGKYYTTTTTTTTRGASHRPLPRSASHGVARMQHVCRHVAQKRHVSGAWYSSGAVAVK